MNNFEYYNPTKIKFGAKMITEVGKEASKIGKKAMLVSYSNLGVLEKTINQIEELLKKENIEIIEFYEISPNPLVSQIEAGIELAKINNIDLVIGIGGGSAMDATKFIAAGFYYEHNIWEMTMSRLSKKVDIPPTRALPTIMIPTLPATSSEMNCGAVITNDKTSEKSYVFNEVIYPRVSIIDPELTLSLPAYQTALGAADAISHAMETYLNIDDNSPLQKQLAKSVITTLIDITPKVLCDLQNLEYRSILQWSASVAWNGWTKAGAAHGAPMHQFGHVISAYNNSPHGATLSVMMPAWMKYTYKLDIDRYVSLAEDIFGISSHCKSKENVALEGIETFEKFLSSINVPIRLSELKVSQDVLEDFTKEVVKISTREDGSLNSRVSIKKEDIFKIYNLAL